MQTDDGPFMIQIRSEVIFFLALSLSVLTLTSVSLAAKLAPPTGKVLLTVQGLISMTNAGQTAVFDRQQLSALGLHTLKTSNPFIKGVHTFEGVYLSDVLKTVGAMGKTITALAIDGYSSDFPVSDVLKYKPLIAMKRDGKVMRVRTKGPLWIVYPIDQFENLKSERFSGRSIWQLITLTVK